MNTWTYYEYDTSNQWWSGEKNNSDIYFYYGKKYWFIIDKTLPNTIPRVILDMFSEFAIEKYVFVHHWYCFLKQQI